ncbi:MAG: AmmeMemoRadiSam system protein B [Thermoanaerobaculales bacterium]|nr:AmmeMemoRadiSam system protein B [Thermoanaerobaculales bacterium]
MRLLGAAAGAMVAIAAAATGGATVRPPAVAGSFYPADRAELRATVDGMLEAARGDRPAPPARAIVVPHAGYVFSGPTAAAAFARLPAGSVRRVILLGPSHHAGFSGAALPAPEVTAFATPLGEVPVDDRAVANLRGNRLFEGPARAHDPEHALEVELPFLQVVAPGAVLVPVVVGSSTDLDGCVGIARALAELVDDGTVVVASSDFTHHGARYGWSPYDGPGLPETLLAVGRRTAERAVAMDPRGFLTQIEVSGDTVCGARPVAVLAALLEGALDGRGAVLEVTTSGHLSGRFDLSVTYAAIAFEGSWTGWRARPSPPDRELTATEGSSLVALARATLGSRLRHDTSVASWFAGHPPADRPLAPAGAFVTVNNTGLAARTEGKLRACMGVVEATGPVVDAVVQAAVWATRDPRFPPLAADELDAVTLEVSVLSPMRPVGSYREIEVGRHGVVLSKDGRRAVFLPQVATEQGWDRETMLEHLSVKAGLPRDAWRDGAAFEVFTAQVFEEHR